MDAIEYLRAIKRRARLIVGVALIGALGAAASSLVIPIRAARPVYEGTATLIQNATTNASGKVVSQTNAQESLLTIGTIAAMVRLPQIAEAVDKTIAYEGEPRDLSSKVTTEVDEEGSLLKISVRAGVRERARITADAFAMELIKYLRERKTAANATEAATVRAQMDRVRAEIGALDRRLARYPNVTVPTDGRRGRSAGPSPADPILQEREAALEQLKSLSQQFQAIRARPADAEGMSLFQPAVVGTATGDGFTFPRPLGLRLLIGFLLGALAAIGLVLVRHRLNRRIQTTEEAEEHFGLPVVGEIPTSRTRRRFRKAVPPPLSPKAADAFRLLGAGLSGGTGRNGSISRIAQPRVIAVTSAGASEGKTTVAANLATTLAEVGKSVLILSTDFRRPQIHQRFGVPNERGLSDVLRSTTGGPILDGIMWHTTAGVWIVPSGTPVEVPDQLLASAGMRRAIMEARQRADVVILDTSPVLTSDVAFLLPQVDSVLVVVRVGMTSPELAQRTGEALRRLSAPVQGLVLNDCDGTALPGGYYQDASLRSKIAARWRTVLRLPRRSKPPRRAQSHAEPALKPAGEVLNGSNGKAARSGRGFPRLSRRSTTR